MKVVVLANKNHSIPLFYALRNNFDFLLQMNIMLTVGADFELRKPNNYPFEVKYWILDLYPNISFVYEKFTENAEYCIILIQEGFPTNEQTSIVNQLKELMSDKKVLVPKINRINHPPLTLDNLIYIEGENLVKFFLKCEEYMLENLQI